MEEIRALVITRLKGDTHLMTQLLLGNVWDRRLKETAPGKTADAFYKLPIGEDAAQITRLRPALVILGPNDVEATDGPVANEKVELRWSFLRFFYYVPATADGKATLDLADRRCRQLLHQWRVQLSIGYPVTVEALEMTEAIDSDEFDGAKVAERRFRGEYLRPVIPF